MGSQKEINFKRRWNEMMYIKEKEKERVSYTMLLFYIFDPCSLQTLQYR